MHALFFEVRPKPGHLKHYFAHVDILKPVLAQHDGLIFLDRYASLTDKDVLLSHQLWEDEAAIVAWRRDSVHRRSQTAGRKVHFEDYRICVAERTLRLQAGHAPEHERTGAALPPATRYAVAAYGTQAPEHPAFAGFKSVNHADAYIALAEADSALAALDLARAIAAAPGFGEAAAYQVLRDYGMHDRAQAPA